MALLPEGHNRVITDISVAHQLPKAREREGETDGKDERKTRVQGCDF
jgi:hypothetical protein